MLPSRHEFVIELLDERATLRQAIAILRDGAVGHSMTPELRETAINDRIEKELKISALIGGLTRYGNFPVLCSHISPGAASFIYLRFHSATGRAPLAETAGSARAGRDGSHEDASKWQHARDHAVSKPRLDRFISRMPSRRCKLGGRRIMRASARVGRFATRMPDSDHSDYREVTTDMFEDFPFV